jgi:hypothetical protein
MLSGITEEATEALDHNLYVIVKEFAQTGSDYLEDLLKSLG